MLNFHLFLLPRCQVSGRRREAACDCRGQSEIARGTGQQTRKGMDDSAGVFDDRPGTILEERSSETG